MRMASVAIVGILSCSITHAAGTAVPRIRLGETIHTEIAAEPDQWGSIDFEFESEAGGPVTIEARSFDFDPALSVLLIDPTGSDSLVAEDQDSAGGADSRLSFEALPSRRYRITVKSMEIPFCGRDMTTTAIQGRTPELTPADRAKLDAEYLAALEKHVEQKATPACAARPLLTRGWALRAKADPAAAMVYADKVLSLAREALGPDHPIEAWGLNLQATLFQDLGNYQKAEELFRESILVLEKRLGPDHPELDSQVNNLGVLLFNRGDLKAGRPIVERALDLFTQHLGPDHIYTSQVLTNLGGLYGRLGLLSEAEEPLARALRIREKELGPSHALVAETLHNMAVNLRLSGHFTEAKPLAERALDIRTEQLGADHPAVSYALDLLATINQDIGAFAEARGLFERSLAIREKRLGPDHVEMGQAQNNLGLVLMLMENPAEARPRFERAIKILEKNVGPESHLLSNPLSNLAVAHVRAGSYHEARKYYERAVTVAEKGLGHEHPTTALNLMKYGQLLRRMGLQDQARPHLERALAIRLKSLGEDHPETGWSFASLANFLHEVGEPGALAAALSAERIGREHLALTARSLAESRALQYASVRASGMDLALTLAAEAPTGDAGVRVWDAVIRSRALVLDEMASRRRASGGSADPAAAKAAQALRSASSRLASLMVRGPGREPPDMYKTMLDDARREKETAEQDLAAKSAAFRQEQANQKLGLPEVLAGLPERSALVGYSVYQHAGKEKPLRSYVAFVGRAGTASPIVVPLGSAEEIDTLVSRWRDEAGRGAVNGEGAYRKTGEALRRTIWDPIASHLDGGAMVFIVPDGTLSLVSLAALPTPNGRYLIEEGPTLHYLSSERDLLTPRAPQAGGGLLALGGAAFDEAAAGGVGASSGRATYRGERSGCGSFATMRFEKLPATAMEVEEISGLWRTNGAAPATLTGADATEAAFKAQAPGHRVLHLATHGFFLDGRCASAMDASRGVGALVEASPVPPPVTGENPLLLSGLALAGANQRATATPDREDGILTAEEIATLDLSGVEWAVLSACDTGVGQVKAGEGVFGLRRAFQVAGAATVIMSLWSVEDESARQWMKALYEGRLMRGLGTAEAVRQAGLSVLRERRAAKQSTHPFFWAGFVAAGEWR